MKKYLIIVDLDETLLNDERAISEHSKKVLRICQGMGHKVVISTARSYIRTVEYAKMLNADFISSFSGNFICDSNDKVIYSEAINSEVSKKVITEVSRQKSRIINEGLYASFCSDSQDQGFIDSNYAAINFLTNLQSYKLIVRCSNEEYFGLKSIANIHNLFISFSERKGIACILPIGTDKWAGIQRVSDYLAEEYLTIAFGDDVTDLKTLLNVDIGVRMKNSAVELVEHISFSTGSNNEDGVARFLSSYFNLENSKTDIDNVKVLDCSLRDGGHLNSSKFGHTVIKSFIEELACANVDIIEVGFLQNSIYDADTAIYPTISSAEQMLSDIDCKNALISVLTQVDKFDINNLEECCGKVKLIRVSFHNNYIDLGMEFCRKIKAKGYSCAINPINFSHYTNDEVVELIKKVNKVVPDIFSIVDTFGVMLKNDFDNKLNLINHLLNKNIKVGIHLHDNLNMAFSSAQRLIESNSFSSSIIIDSSVCGIGRAPGNLQTELLLYYLNNLNNGKRYKMEYIYSLMEEVVALMKNTLDWNKHFAYSISAFENAHRTYAEFLLKKDVHLKNIEMMIEHIPMQQRGRFNEELISSIYKEEL